LPSDRIATVGAPGVPGGTSGQIGEKAIEVPGGRVRAAEPLDVVARGRDIEQGRHIDASHAFLRISHLCVARKFG
jgi:hypothetical protein